MFCSYIEFTQRDAALADKQQNRDTELRIEVAALKPKSTFAKDKVDKATTLLQELEGEKTVTSKRCDSFLEEYDNEYMKNQQRVDEYSSGEELLMSALDGLMLHN